MQSENFDKKIKDSLSQRPPGNESPEWEKMEPLLDAHLPVRKKDRRRIFFIFFFFLVLGGGAFFISQNNSEEKKNVTETKVDTDAIQKDQPSATDRWGENDNSTPGTNSISVSPNNTAEAASSQKKDEPDSEDLARIQSQDLLQNLPPQKTGIDPKRKNISKDNQSTELTNKNEIVKQSEVEQPDNLPVKKTAPEKSVQDNAVVINSGITKNNNEKSKDPENINPDPIDNNTRDDKASLKNNSEEQKQPVSQPKQTANSKNPKQKTKSSFLNNLFFTVSAGPDFSTVGLERTGELEPVFGAGIGYQFSKKFSIRTGFYSARKVYSADPDDYHPPYNFWAYYPNLKNIDANCKVYEFPVTIDYTISQNKKQSWFASAGLSSILMKKETYDYYFKPNSSPTYITYTRTINNENKHFFSMVNVSGGYTRNINKNLSLRAEPYAKFSLDGVGYGKVRLNSGGVLLSAIIKPFAKD